MSDLNLAFLGPPQIAYLRTEQITFPNRKALALVDAMWQAVEPLKCSGQPVAANGVAGDLSYCQA